MIEAKEGAIFVEQGYPHGRVRIFQLDATGEWVEIALEQIFRGAIDSTDYADNNCEYAELIHLL